MVKHETISKENIGRMKKAYDAGDFLPREKMSLPGRNIVPSFLESKLGTGT